jgi:hypothetical protein
MTRKIPYILIAMTLVACGKKEVLDVAPEFQPYVGRFEQVSAKVGSPVTVSDLIVKFGPMLHKNENGACEVMSDKTPTVTINEKVWNQMDDLERESLMFHELGHCVLHRNHKKEITAQGVPVSIMNPYRIDSFLYEENTEYYHQELFKQTGEF